MLALGGSGLIPVLDGTIPAAGDHARRFDGVPLAADEHSVVTFEFLENAMCLPVPDPKIARSIARDHIVSIRREAQLQ